MAARRMLSALELAVGVKPVEQKVLQWLRVEHKAGVDGVRAGGLVRGQAKHTVGQRAAVAAHRPFQAVFYDEGHEDAVGGEILGKNGTNDIVGGAGVPWRVRRPGR